MKHRAISYFARVTFHNEDTGQTVTDDARGPLRLRKNFQREVTKFTDSGTVTVFAQISVAHWRGGNCYSDPGLYESIFVY